MAWFTPKDATLRRSDLVFVDAVQAARQVEGTPGASWAIYLMLALLVSGIGWASVAQVDMVSRADARVVPDGREQVIASLEGGLLRELMVREGQAVEAGQPLALLDPTRAEAQQNEGQAKRMALRGAIARLQAEATGRPLVFGPALKGASAVVAGETESYQARARALQEAVAMNRRSLGLLERELAMAESMSAKGLMSEVEVMRVRRQLNELELQTQERINRFRQDASAELVRLQTELSQLDEQMVVRRDLVEHTVLKSPVRGLVKRIAANTVGGVVGPGAVVMEIVPLGDRVLVEARIRPADIGFIQVGQGVEIKLSAYESTVYGSLHGTIRSISPDVLGDTERGAAEATWYRAVVQADSASLQAGGRPLAVLPGMSGQAEIHTGQRSVLSYLLRPVLKSKEAFRER
ncbi:HlyD family type I secretion periplasmic adaptor subunit [Ideonella sp. A 288]|uniref:HlyD family type I secretion periplasmic adaptor subunit n=1 Tax=Ideonella sp. A 288 TaxID=1962181 RepID=UPI000B4B205B|nr:HlyD family type I secretion periplasmic adaptor subunit [Ideonella sp. A 288]